MKKAFLQIDRVSVNDLAKLVEGGLRQSRLFAPNPRDLSEEDVKGIYQKAL